MTRRITERSRFDVPGYAHQPTHDVPGSADAGGGTVRRVLIATVAANVLAALLVILLPTHSDEVAAAAAPTPCDWQAEYDRTIAQLGDDPAHWFRVRGDLMSGYNGRTDLDAGQSYVNPATPCEQVADTVRHEWMHLQQARAHGGAAGAYRAYPGERLEIVADCGSWLLGSNYTPYRQKRLDEHGVACSARDLADARQLLSGRR